MNPLSIGYFFFFFFKLYTRKMYKMRIYYYFQHRFYFFYFAINFCQVLLNSPILSTSYPYLLTYEIMKPIWILEIKTSDSVWESCSHLEKVRQRRRRQGREENGKFAKKEMRIYRNKSKTISCIRINSVLLWECNPLFTLYAGTCSSFI